MGEEGCGECGGQVLVGVCHAVVCLGAVAELPPIHSPKRGMGHTRPTLCTLLPHILNSR